MNVSRRYCLFGSLVKHPCYLHQIMSIRKWSKTSAVRQVIDMEKSSKDQNKLKFMNKPRKKSKYSSVESLEKKIDIKSIKIGVFDKEKYKQTVEVYLPKTRLRANASKHQGSWLDSNNGKLKKMRWGKKLNDIDKLSKEERRKNGKKVEFVDLAKEAKLQRKKEKLKLSTIVVDKETDAINAQHNQFQGKRRLKTTADDINVRLDDMNKSFTFVHNSESAVSIINRKGKESTAKPSEYAKSADMNYPQECKIWYHNMVKESMKKDKGKKTKAEDPKSKLALKEIPALPKKPINISFSNINLSNQQSQSKEEKCDAESVSGAMQNASAAATTTPMNSSIRTKQWYTKRIAESKKKQKK